MSNQCFFCYSKVNFFKASYKSIKNDYLCNDFHEVFLISFAAILECAFNSHVHNLVCSLEEYAKTNDCCNGLSRFH